MKRISFLFLIVITLTCICPAQSVENQMKSFLHKKEFFRLRTALQNNADNISEASKLYFDAYVANAFNRNNESIDHINKLLDQYKSSLSDSDISALLYIQQDNYSKTYQYNKAGKICDELTGNYSQVMDTTILKDIETSGKLWNALSQVQKQEVEINSDETLPWKRDKAGLMNIPVSIADTMMNFVFDTGANLSTLNKKTADMLGLKIFDVSLNVGSSTGINNISSLCVADSLKLGNILFRNVVFLVLPDELLNFPQIDYRINGIIGYPVIEQLKEIKINKNEIISIPLQPEKTNLNNLALDELMPIVSFAVNNDTLCFHFDTGAKNTDLFKPYFEKYKPEITKQGKPEITKRGGAGGIVESKVYKIKDVVINCGNGKATLPEVSILINDINESGDKFYGNIGQDLISQFDEMIINFEYMYIDFK